jgi:hypothetical protein
LWWIVQPFHLFEIRNRVTNTVRDQSPKVMGCLQGTWVGVILPSGRFRLFSSRIYKRGVVPVPIWRAFDDTARPGVGF